MAREIPFEPVAGPRHHRIRRTAVAGTRRWPSVPAMQCGGNWVSSGSSGEWQQAVASTGIPGSAAIPAQPLQVARGSTAIRGRRELPDSSRKSRWVSISTKTRGPSSIAIASDRRPCAGRDPIEKGNQFASMILARHPPTRGVPHRPSPRWRFADPDPPESIPPGRAGLRKVPDA